MNFRSFGATLECGACSHETSDLCEKTFLMIPAASLYGQTFILSQDFLEKRKQNFNGHTVPMELLFVALKQNHCRFFFACLKDSWLHKEQLCLLPFFNM